MKHVAVGLSAGAFVTGALARYEQRQRQGSPALIECLNETHVMLGILAALTSFTASRSFFA
jgi:hypothetical protein